VSWPPFGKPTCCWLIALIDPVADTPVVTTPRSTVAVLGMSGTSLVHDTTVRATRTALPAAGTMRHSRPPGA
jgi:hypothetical protein